MRDSQSISIDLLAWVIKTVTKGIKKTSYAKTLAIAAYLNKPSPLISPRWNYWKKSKNIEIEASQKEFFMHAVTAASVVKITIIASYPI